MLKRKISPEDEVRVYYAHSRIYSPHMKTCVDLVGIPPGSVYVVMVYIKTTGK